MEQHDKYNGMMADDFLSEADIFQSAELTDDEKRELLSQRFARTASNGDVNALERMWETCHGDKWVDIDYRDDQGSTPLICASCFGHTHIAELLLNNGANVNSQDISGWTALMWATTNHNEELVRVLLGHGASSSAKTARGHTAINIASSNLSAGSGSDTDSFMRASDSPSNREAVLGDSPPSRFEDQAAGGSESGSLKATAGVGDGSCVGSPHSTDHSAIGIPGRRISVRDSVSAGQSVLSMLQASSAMSSRNILADGLNPMTALGSGLTGTGSQLRRASATSAADMSAADGSQLDLGDDTLPNSKHQSFNGADDSGSALAGRLRALTMDHNEQSDKFASGDTASENGDDDKDEPQPFDWDTLQLDQMYVISPATVPQFLHAVVKDIQPERWIRSSVLPEHKFVPASMIFLAARFAHHLGTPDFLDSFLADTIASIIHEVQTHKLDPVRLVFWMSNIQTLIYFLKRDTTLVQITSEAQGRMSECMHDAYALLIKAVEVEIEPLIDTSLLAFESMPELFADVKMEAEKSQRLSMFFFGGQADSTPKSTDGRPLRRSQTILGQSKGGARPRRGSILSPTKAPTAVVGGPATTSGGVPAWVVSVERLKGSAAFDHGAMHSSKRQSSGDTFVSGRSSHDSSRTSLSKVSLFGTLSPRTIPYMFECLLDLLDMCEIHPCITWGVMRQMFCYLGGEMFNRVLTTRDFCSRSQAMQVRMNLTQINDWVRTHSKRLVIPHTKSSKGVSEGSAVPVPVDSSVSGPPLPTAESLLYKAFFDPLVELLELLQCLTHLPDLGEYFETIAKMQNLNILQQETAVSNYRYEVQERRINGEIVAYLESVAKEIRDGQRADREKQSLDRASRRSSASVFSERRTMDGRPSLLSLDLTTGGQRGVGGLVRFSAEPAVNAGLASDVSSYAERASGSHSRDTSLNIPMSRLSSESMARSPTSSSGIVSMMPPLASSSAASPGAGAGPVTITRGRAGGRTAARRGLLLPIARPGSTVGAKPSARSLFAGQSAGGSAGPNSTSIVNTRLSESLEPISETSSVISLQRSSMTIDTNDECSDDGGSNRSVCLSGGFSSDVFSSQSAHTPTTAPVNGGGWAKSNIESNFTNCESLSSSLRGPKGKKCLPENMSELLDSMELLPFAVPTSRDWLAWWQAQSAGLVQSSFSGIDSKHSREWSNETVSFYQNRQSLPQSLQQHNMTGAAAAGMSLKSVVGAGEKLRSELAPVVPSEFLNVLNQIV